MAIINMKASLVVGDGQPIIRRFTSEEGASLDYQSLLSSLKQLFPDHMKDKFTIHWIGKFLAQIKSTKKQSFPLGFGIITA